MTRMGRILAITVLAVAVSPRLPHAQSSSGAKISAAPGCRWARRGAAAADPKIAPPPATPIVLKPAYAKMFEARRAADAEATKR